MRPAQSAFSVLFVALALSACGGSDSPTAPDEPDEPDTPAAPTVKDDPSFSADIVPIFTREGCTASGCHGSASSAGLNLATSPRAALVGIPSSETGEHRVIAGNANDSYLVKKLEGRQTVGARMPIGGQIGSTDLTNIKNWINQGAKNN